MLWVLFSFSLFILVPDFSFDWSIFHGFVLLLDGCLSFSPFWLDFTFFCSREPEPKLDTELEPEPLKQVTAGQDWIRIRKQPLQNGSGTRTSWFRIETNRLHPPVQMML